MILNLNRIHQLE